MLPSKISPLEVRKAAAFLPFPGLFIDQFSGIKTIQTAIIGEHFAL